MRVWEATEADIPDMLAMSERFAARANLPGYSLDLAEKWGRALLEMPNAVILRTEKGMIGAVAQPLFSSTAITVGELFWWAEGRDGIVLLDALIEWAEAFGADQVTVSTLEGVTPVGVARVLDRKGFSLQERAYLRRL